MESDTVWFGLLAKSALNGLTEYNEKSETLLQSAKRESFRKIEEEVSRIAKELSLNEDEEYGEWSVKMQEHEGTYDILFTNFFRYSFLILAYAILEDHLYRLCIALYDAKRVEEPLKLPKYNIVKSYRSYIDKAASSVGEELWAKIEDLQFIRNCIAHNSGDVSRSKHKIELFRIAQMNVGIHISHKSHREGLTRLYLRDNMIIIEPKYCKSIALNMRDLIETICKATNLPTSIDFENGSIIFR